MFEKGTVLRIFAEEARPEPKVKYVIIIGGNSESVFFVFINTEVNLNHLPENLQGLHLPVLKSECPYLTEDESYADCSEVFTRSKASLNQMLQKEPGRIQKPILPETKINALIDIIRRAKSISLADKKKYGVI